MTLPKTKRSASLVYHVYDPDDPKSLRSGCGAQILGPEGEYCYKECKDVSRFEAEAHELDLRLDFPSSADAKIEKKKKNFFRVEERGTKHSGYLSFEEEAGNADAENRDSLWWDCAVRSYVEWDIEVTPLRTYGSGNGNGVGDKGGGGAVSPAGWLTSLPLLEPHYQILFAHALASGYVECDGKRTEFVDVPFYAEKNWGGGGFPRKWFWMQCNSFPNYPDLSVVATGANRGVVMLPGTYEDVGLIAIHYGDLFVQFSPVGSDKMVKTKSSYVGENSIVRAKTFEWNVSPWGNWKVVAKGETYECEITGFCEKDLSKCESTILHAPAPDSVTGMLPLCRETFRGDLSASLYRVDPKTKTKTPVFEHARSEGTACLEVGGGPWKEPWEIQADVKDIVAEALALTDVNVDAIQKFGQFVGLDVVPGL